MRDLAFAPAVRHPFVEIRHAAQSGRYTVASQDIPEGFIIDTIPVIVVPHNEVETLRKTELFNYVFEWDEQERYLATGDLVQCDPRYCQGVALGLISLCNHSFTPNAEYRFNYEDQSIDWVALQPISAGEEITIHYRVPIWFEMASSDELNSMAG